MFPLDFWGVWPHLRILIFHDFLSPTLWQWSCSWFPALYRTWPRARVSAGQIFLPPCVIYKIARLDKTNNFCLGGMALISPRLKVTAVFLFGLAEISCRMTFYSWQYGCPENRGYQSKISGGGLLPRNFLRKKLQVFGAYGGFQKKKKLDSSSETPCFFVIFKPFTIFWDLIFKKLVG